MKPYTDKYNIGGGQNMSRWDNNSGNSNRRSRRDSGRSGDREMFNAVCDDCGKDCKVPFKPSGDKPIYCSRCFEKHDERGQRSDSRNSSRRNDRRSNGRDRYNDNRRGRTRDVQRADMYHATCANCGNDCEVPFKPTGEKPIYCDNCFGNKNSRPDPISESLIEELKDEINSINGKLDMLLEALKPVLPKVSEDGEVEFKKRKTLRAEEKGESIELK